VTYYTLFLSYLVTSSIMKLNAVAAAMSAAMLTGNVHAEDVKEASPSVPDKLPTFTVSS
jgi:hypothetical protein